MIAKYNIRSLFDCVHRITVPIKYKNYKIKNITNYLSDFVIHIACKQLK